MEYLPLIATVSLLNLLAAMSPGPDFVMVVRNALNHNRNIAIYTSLGIALGLTVHILYCVAGIGIIISKSIVLFNIIKFLGAMYLIYMGISTMLSKGSKLADNDIETVKQLLTPMQAVKTGFLTNVLNPKATLFFLGLFTFVIRPGTPIYVLIILTIIVILTAIIWFTIVSVFFTQKKIKDAFFRFERKINLVFGGLLILLGLKIAFTTR
jgi:RhtB (resistance to homoserine/threonine) family protein